MKKPMMAVRTCVTSTPSTLLSDFRLLELDLIALGIHSVDYQASAETPGLVHRLQKAAGSRGGVSHPLE
jgi:hypothetical protein